MIRKTDFLAAVLILSVLGCAGQSKLSDQDKNDGKTFWTHRYQYIRLIPRDQCLAADTAANSHPQDLGERLRVALAALRIDLPDKEKAVPIFTRAELDQMTGPLLQAFMKASPDEDVGMAIEGVHPREFGYQRCVTTARFFLQDEDELHVIFGMLHEPLDEYDTPFHAEPKDYRLHPLLPGSRCEKAGKKFPSIIATSTVRLREQDNAPRKNWLAINLAAQPQPAVPVPMAMPAAPHPPTVTAPTPVRDANRMTQPPVQGSQKSVLERLQILKDLRVKGLITEQEYLDKKKEILDSL